MSEERGRVKGEGEASFSDVVLPGVDEVLGEGHLVCVTLDANGTVLLAGLL